MQTTSKNADSDNTRRSTERAKPANYPTWTTPTFIVGNTDNVIGHCTLHAPYLIHFSRV